MLLSDEVVVMRQLLPDDVDEWLAADDAEQVHWFEFPGPAPRRDVERAITAWSESRPIDGPVRYWAICDLETGGLVGGVELGDLGDSTVNLSYVVFPDFRRQGIATRASRLALAYARDELGARHARIEVLPDNVASLGVVQNLGATFAGRGTNQAGRDLDAYELEL